VTATVGARTLVRSLDLTGRAAVVTGGHGDLAEAIAGALAELGCAVALAARRVDACEALAHRLESAYGVRALPIATDVSQEDEVERLMERTKSELGSIDVVVNGAATFWSAPAEDVPLERGWRRVIDVNLTGTFLGMQAVVEEMKKAGGGSIINVSSIEGLRGAPMVHPYVASKWAVRGLAKSAAIELGPKNIRVNSIHPGFIRTPMTKHFPDDMVTAPLRRPGQSEEVAPFVVFLVSDESSFATGAEFIMDGGLVTDVPHKALPLG
jgi:3alpha(or 20beta)-hydroxysteroid dehydrogenase